MLLNWPTKPLIRSSRSRRLRSGVSGCLNPCSHGLRIEARRSKYRELPAMRKNARFWVVILSLILTSPVSAKEGVVEDKVTFSAGEIEIKGLFETRPQLPAIGAVVCHPHPLYGGESH